jgi:hypothetical protein
MGRSGTGNQVPRDHSSGRRRANKQASCHDGEQATPLEPCSRCCNWQHRGPRYYAARHDSAQDLLWIPEQAWAGVEQAGLRCAAPCCTVVTRGRSEAKRDETVQDVFGDVTRGDLLCRNYL